jgi:hypothetical protein
MNGPEDTARVVLYYLRSALPDEPIVARLIGATDYLDSDPARYLIGAPPSAAGYYVGPPCL